MVGEENRSDVEIAGDLTSPQAEDDKTIKIMVKDIMGQLKPMKEMNEILDKVLICNLVKGRCHQKRDQHK